MTAVLHIINGEHYAGAERVQDLLALRLPEHGFEVAFACLKPGRFPEARRAKDAPLHALAMRGRWDLRPAWQIARLVRQCGYRLIHAHTPRTLMIGRLAGALSGVPTVYHVHSPTSRDTTRRWTNRVNSCIERWSLTGVAQMIAVSESLRRHIEQAGFDPRRLRVVHNGVPGLGPLAHRDRPRDVWTLGTVALIRPRKGIETLLEALAALRNEGLPVRLRAVGPFETPDYETAVKDRAAELGLLDAIDWVGFSSDVPGELARMDLFVLPSLFGEGLPMVVLEAMAAGVPVVAGDVEGIPEAITDGREGRIVPAGDHAALAEAIRQVIHGCPDWCAMRAQAWARHAEQFSDGAMAAGVAAAYRDVLGDGVPRSGG